MMNVEASNEAMEELSTTFRYNDAVIRNLVIRRDEQVTEESLIMKAEKEDRERKSRYQERQAAETRAPEAEKDNDNEDAAADAEDPSDSDNSEE
jgi:small subunit ribosomal protein S6